MDTLELCKEFMNRARDIVQQESMFEMRRRMNGHHSSKQVDEETKLHNMHQQIAWQIVKKLYCENKDAIILYRQGLDFKSDKNTIDAIVKVIDEEIDSIVLGDEDV